MNIKCFNQIKTSSRDRNSPYMRSENLRGSSKTPWMHWIYPTSEALPERQKIYFSICLHHKRSLQTVGEFLALFRSRRVDIWSILLERIQHLRFSERKIYPAKRIFETVNHLRYSTLSLNTCSKLKTNGLFHSLLRPFWSQIFTLYTPSGDSSYRNYQHLSKVVWFLNCNCKLQFEI